MLNKIAFHPQLDSLILSSNKNMDNLRFEQLKSRCINMDIPGVKLPKYLYIVITGGFTFLVFVFSCLSGFFWKKHKNLKRYIKTQGVRVLQSYWSVDHVSLEQWRVQWSSDNKLKHKKKIASVEILNLKFSKQNRLT